MTRVFGWDLGGVNVKLSGRWRAHCRCSPDPLPDHCRAQQIRCGRRGGVAADYFPCPACRHHDRRIVRRVQRPGGRCRLPGRADAEGSRRVRRFASMQAASAFSILTMPRHRTLEVASANWHATAALAARHHEDALLVDVGTTTTDLIPIKDGTVAARGATDAERLTEGELLYTGVVRTPVMAVAHSAASRGACRRLRRSVSLPWPMSGGSPAMLPDDADPYPSADQRGKSGPESAARLARMLGARRKTRQNLARGWRSRATSQIASLPRSSMRRAVFPERDDLPQSAPVIGAGCGRFVARAPR